MRRIGLTFVAVLALVACTTTINIGGMRGSGDMTSETRDVAGFTRVVLQGSGVVNITVDGAESLNIEAEDNLIPHLTSEVANGTLTLGTDTSISPTREIVYTLTASTLDGVVIEGSGNVETGDITADTFDAHISGSGRIDLTDMTLGTLVASIDGSGNIDASGSADMVEVSIPGSGSFDGENLVGVTGSVDISGSGHAVVNVSDSLEASVSGSGSIEYVGDPSVDSDISGSGSISER